MHYLTVHDFEELARQEKWNVERRIFLAGNRTGTLWPNLMAETAVFLIRK
ncbi:MAG TPA: methionine biosynthesis protein MetW [Bryobacteraceae bacterium]|nr:methionine biosynthesis protein MetW [Bryobacteraceae bacterium]